MSENSTTFMTENELRRKEFVANLQLKVLEMEVLRFFVEMKIDKESNAEDSQKAERFIGRIKKMIDEAKKLISLYGKDISYSEFVDKYKRKIVLLDLQDEILLAEILRDLLSLVVDYYISVKGKPREEFETNLENIEHRITYFINYKKKGLEEFKER